MSRFVVQGHDDLTEEQQCFVSKEQRALVDTVTGRVLFVGEGVEPLPHNWWVACELNALAAELAGIRTQRDRLLAAVAAQIEAWAAINICEHGTVAEARGYALWHEARKAVEALVKELQVSRL